MSRRPLKYVYLDLDGTLLGYGGSLLRAGSEQFSLASVQALELCAGAGVTPVLMSGRRQAQVAEDARLLGITDYIYEAGCVIVIAGEEHYLTGSFQPGEQSIYEQIETAGAPQLLFDSFPGRLEYHEPWHYDRDITHLLRGSIDLDVAHQLLAEHDLAELRLIDNGMSRRTMAALDPGERVRVYHLAPCSAGKGAAVAYHMRALGLEREECIAIGDARADFATEAVVDRFWLVGGERRSDPQLIDEVVASENAQVVSGSAGIGVFESVLIELEWRGQV
jgi:hydroxymethylpyrimidine pyrophosphatase-like HAD family hydrolase